MKPEITFPPAFKRIFEPHRLKVFYGGRGSAKSESVARYLLIEGAKEPMNILCCREFQASIKDSVHQLLSDLIQRYNLDSFYTVTNTEIRGQNGTLFIFSGLRNKIMSIKSMHNIKKCWVEEAQTMSYLSLQILLPTIRAEGSEILFTMNPELEEDPSYQALIADPPAGTLVVKVNYDQNPYFPEVLRIEMENMKKKDMEEYRHVWLGECRQAVEGAVFTKQLQRAAEEQRITDSVEWNPSVPVHTYWDLGKSDKTAIWFCQYVGQQWRVLRHYSNFLQPIEHYFEYVKSQPYNYGTHYLPHDARQDRLGMVRSIEEMARVELGNVSVVDRVQHKVNSIEAAKAIFPMCWFHKTDCSDGLSDLRRYRYDLDPQTGKIGKEPKHDIYSDSADAFQCFAMAATPDIVYEEYSPPTDYGRLG